MRFLNDDGRTATVYKIDDEFITSRFPRYNDEKNGSVCFALAIDVETTGLDHEICEVIEVAAVLFAFNSDDGKIIGIVDDYSEMQEVEKVPEKITKITGITLGMLRGKKIDWEKLKAMVNKSDIILAHNASFDRKFIRKHIPETDEKIWGCSKSQVDWFSENMDGRSLITLCIVNGFFFDGHRALNDVYAMIVLLNMSSIQDERPYLRHMLDDAKKTHHLCSISKGFESKGKIKERGYRYDGQKKWVKIVEDVKAEEIFVSSLKDRSIVFAHRELKLQERFLCN